MDPLSIAASIAGVITIADSVFGRLMKFARFASHAATEAKAWAAEINSVATSVSSLSRLAQALEDDPAASTLQMHHIERCHHVLSSINKLLQKAEKDLESPKVFTSLQRKLQWTLSSGRIKELMADLAEHKTSILLATSADSMNRILRCLAQGSGIQASLTQVVDEVKETRQITNRIYQDSQRKTVLAFFLKAVNPQSSYETCLRLRHPRTELWLMQMPAIQTWITTAGSKLWLSGIPGAGKTVLAGSLIETALSKCTEQVAVAFFFCDYKDENTHAAVNILGVLAAQLAMQKEEAYARLAGYYDELHPPNHLPKGPSVHGLQSTLSDIWNAMTIPT